MKPDKEQLWVEGFYSFLNNFRYWLIWAFPFFIIDFISGTLLDKWEPQKSIDEKLNQIWPVATPLAFLFLFLECYFFTLLFLKQKSLNEEPKFSWQGFFYALGQFALTIITVFSPFLLYFIIFYLDKRLGFATLPNGSKVLINISELIAVSSLSVYLGIRCMTIMPLAIGNIKSPFVKSWQLTSGNIWRIVWNIFLWWIFTSVFFGLAEAGRRELPSAQNDSETAKTIIYFIGQLVDSSIEILYVGCAIAFMYAVARLLYRETTWEDKV